MSLLDAQQAAALLNVPATWIAAEARARRIPHIRLGRYVRTTRRNSKPGGENEHRGRGELAALRRPKPRGGMTDGASQEPVAEIRVHGERGVFVATTCTLEPGICHADGRWRRGVGLNNTEDARSGPRSYTWPTRELRRIRWLATEHRS